MASSSLLFTFRTIPLINTVLARRGIDGAELLAECGLPLDALSGDITAPLGRIQRFVATCAERLDNDLFGLDLADLVPTGTYGMTEFLTRSAPSAEVGLTTFCEHAALINPIGRFRFVVGPEGGRLTYTVAAQRDTLGTQLNEYSIAFIARQLAAVLGPPILASVWFSHAGGRRAAAVEKRFGVPVRFGAADCGFAISPEVVARVPKTADPALFAFLLEQARAQLSRLGPIDIVSQVVRVIEARLPHGDLNANAIAAVMATTTRSLQRHLAEAGTSYRDVLAHVRSRRRGELRRGGITDSEIALQLGFADARSMRRSLTEDDSP
ncbi:MAG: AraC family transcriptional regulator ligand-binding domain-containing protein [Kofleriaceae bacterium]